MPQIKPRPLLLNKVAWVSKHPLKGYHLHVVRIDDDAQEFRHMDGRYFSDFRLAQDMANTIRYFVKLRRYHRARGM